MCTYQTIHNIEIYKNWRRQYVYWITIFTTEMTIHIQLQHIWPEMSLQQVVYYERNKVNITRPAISIGLPTSIFFKSPQGDQVYFTGTTTSIVNTTRQIRSFHLGSILWLFKIFFVPGWISEVNSNTCLCYYRL